MPAGAAVDAGANVDAMGAVDIPAGAEVTVTERQQMTRGAQPKMPDTKERSTPIKHRIRLCCVPAQAGFYRHEL